MNIADDLKSAYEDGYEKGFADGFEAGQRDVQPDCKKGKWISHYDEDAKEGWYECSYCHSERAFNTKYCPGCGTDMRG